jgi:hypothetical protein
MIICLLPSSFYYFSISLIAGNEAIGDTLTRATLENMQQYLSLLLLNPQLIHDFSFTLSFS